jgi:general secretion pathway protein L
MTALLASPPLAILRRFLDWWAAELSEIIAARSSARKAWDVMFVRRSEGCDAFVRSGKRIEQIGTPQTGGNALAAELRRRLGRNVSRPHVVLRLQPGEVVQSRISVPAGASEVMEPVLNHQIERLAPWPAGKALLAYEIAGPAAEPGMLDVRVAIAGRQRIETLVAELEVLGYRPDVVDFGTEPSAIPRLNLLPRQRHDNRRSGRVVLSIVGMACALALIAGALGLADLAQTTHELGALNARLEELRARGRQDRDAEGLARRQQRAALLAAEKAAQPSAAVVLEALSRAVPDDAWLERLEIGQGSVRLAGNAVNAASLIGRIEASGHFRDVQFAAPTTRVEAENHESFTITAQIVPGKELEP